MYVTLLRLMVGFLIFSWSFPSLLMSQEADLGPSWYFIESSWKVKTGDDPEWAAVEFDDSDWAVPKSKDGIFHEGPFDEVPEGIFWIRVKLVITAESIQGTVDSLINQVKGAREIFWDGQKIGGTGVVGIDRKSEIPGLNVHLPAIPDSLLTKGTHQIAIRVSSNYEKVVDGPILDTLILSDDSYVIPQAFMGDSVYRAMFGFSGAIAVICLLIYVFADRRLSYLLFSLLSGCLAFLLFLESYEVSHLHDLTYYQDTQRGYLSLGTVFVLSLLVPAFFLSHFSARYKTVHLLWIVIILIVGFYSTPLHDLRMDFLVRIGIGTGCLFGAWAVWRGKPGSRLILAGTVVSLLPSFIGDIDRFVLLGHVIFVFCVFASLTLQIGREKAILQQTLLNKAELETSKARLETELIKRSIQPHFLMNTLNALVEWVEENPKKGIAFVHELSRHFRILLEISGRKEIAISQEIELCHSLLAIMSYRMGIRYRMIPEGVDPEEQIPPCIFHTLVENGVTHNEYTQGAVEFKLIEERGESRRYYSLVTPFENAGELETAEASNNLSLGTGLKYVESRLEESYPGRWQLWNGRVRNHWITRIEILLSQN